MDDQICSSCGDKLQVPQARLLSLITDKLASYRRRGKKKLNPDDAGQIARDKGDDCNGFQPKGTEREMRFLRIPDNDQTISMTPSAKTWALKTLILEWQANHPEDKIIGGCFSSPSCILKPSRWYTDDP
jgi:rRNA maturation protein Nop10